MSEIKLPSEVIEQINKQVPKSFESINEGEYTYGYAVKCLREGAKFGAKIAAAHYEQENKRLAELLSVLFRAQYDYTYYVHMDLDDYEEMINKDWQQYCRDNNIKE